MTLRTRSITLLATLGLLIAPGASLAGMVQHERVQVSSTSMGGSFGSTHNSNNPSEYIACTDYSDFGISFCSARDAAGDYGSCTTSNGTQRSLIRSLSDSDTIYIGRSGGSCRYVRVKKGSMNEPK